MHTLVICGTPWCDLKSVEQQLQFAGMAPPRPATGRVVETMEDWHQSLFGRAGTPAKLQAMRPGKAWELAASELFLANWQQTVWGWADARSTWLLDFWRDFDPHTHFILVHTPASEALAHAAAHTHHTPFSASTTLDQWCAHQTELLAFYLRHRDRCTWVQSAQIGNPATWLGTADQPWAQDLQPSRALPDGHVQLSPSSRQTHADTDPVLHQLLISLAHQAVAQHGQAQAVQDELQATLPALASAEAPPAAFDALQASDLLHHLADQIGNQLKQRLAQLQHQHNEVQASHQHLLGQLQQLELLQLGTAQQLNERQQELGALTHAFNQLNAQLAHETQGKAQAHAQATELQARLAQQQHQHLQQQQEAAQENELLLVQLHQVQEELESTFLKGQAQQQQLEALQKAQADIQAKLNAEAKARADLQAKLTSEAKAQADTQAKLNTEAKARADLQRQLAHVQHTQQETAQESELLLLQLHQVQEELEHYFLQHQQTQQDLAHSHERLAKWAQRYPHHCEWDSLTALQATDDQLHLQLRGLQHGSRVLDAFGLQLSASTRSLHLERTGAQGSPLLRWPEGLADPQALVLTLGQTTNRKGSLQTTVQPSAVVSQLSPSDLNLLRALCLNLAEALPQDLPHRAHWVAQCRPWAQALDALPPTWRFDRLNLRHEQVNPDYEHLWFSLDNVQYGARHWPRFEFRLSAANVRKNSFSHLPKLEFPLPEGNANKQFDNWFEESEDDKGPKFELRFDTKTPAMDMACWRALSTVDQAQCLALLQHLPRMLALLQSAGATIHRPWADWQQQVVGIQHTVATCLNLPIALLSLPDLSAPHEPRTANA